MVYSYINQMREKKKLRNQYYGNFKVVIFGDPEVGKSTLSQKYLINLFHSDSKMTIGVNFYTKDIIVNDKPYKIHFWDLTEKEIFRSLLPWYVRGAEGGLFIYDVTNYASLSHLDEWLTIIKKEIKEEDQFPIIVVGNKGDLKDDREISGEEGIQFAKSREVDGFIECSAKTGENVQEMFESLTKLMLNNIKKKKRGNYRQPK